MSRWALYSPSKDFGAAPSCDQRHHAFDRVVHDSSMLRRGRTLMAIHDAAISVTAVMLASARVESVSRTISTICVAP